MRADNDIDRAVRHAFQRGFGGFTVVETRKAGDFHGEIGETVGEVLRVLLDQKRGRREYGDLFAAHHRHKRGAQRDFGFAETDIATHEAVHRLRLRQIFNHGGDGGGLVFGFLVAEAVGKCLIVQLVDFELVSRLGGALGVEIEQLGGGVACFFGGFALRLVPRAAAELVQGDIFMRLAGVAAD